MNDWQRHFLLFKSCMNAFRFASGYRTMTLWEKTEFFSSFFAQIAATICMFVVDSCQSSCGDKFEALTSYPSFLQMKG